MLFILTFSNGTILSWLCSSSEAISGFWLLGGAGLGGASLGGAGFGGRCFTSECVLYKVHICTYI